MAPSMPKFRFFSFAMAAEYVAHVEINRPEKLNAFYDPMWHEMKAVFEYLSLDSDVRCVLLSGAGPKAFTAGKHTQSRPYVLILFMRQVLSLALLQASMSP
jgi:Delta3,5-Delta2,4-dienoyl-CoA isomerase